MSSLSQKLFVIKHPKHLSVRMDTTVACTTFLQSKHWRVWTPKNLNILNSILSSTRVMMTMIERVNYKLMHFFKKWLEGRFSNYSAINTGDWKRWQMKRRKPLQLTFFHGRIKISSVLEYSPENSYKINLSADFFLFHTSLVIEIS